VLSRIFGSKRKITGKGEKYTGEPSQLLIFNKQIVIKDNYMGWACRTNGGGEKFIENFERKSLRV
jgi:hypothetical protein